MEWPKDLKLVQNHHMDSSRWQGFPFRKDDIVVASWGKAGTTLTQQLVGQIISGGDPEFNTGAASPWLDLRAIPLEDIMKGLEQQKHRRFIKTHLPPSALPYDPNVKYIHLCRDGRDVAWSIYNHHCQANDPWYKLINDTPGRVGPPVPHPDPDVRAYFHTWLRNDGAPWWPFFSHMRSWWDARLLPNVMLLHFSALTRDLPGEARRLASFLGVSVPEERWPAILEHCTKDWMRDHGDKVMPMMDVMFKDGARGFIYKGTNGRWRDTLTSEDCAEYEDVAKRELGEECAKWLASGEPADAKQVR